MITFFENGVKILNQPKEKPLNFTSPPEPGVPAPKGQLFEIRVKGHVSEIWADWFEGMTIEYLDNGEMNLSGYIVDQSALMGVLNKLVRLNLTLISLKEIKKHKEKK
jgi:hypothetical protein